MAFLSLVRTLIGKNLRLALLRHAILCAVMALVLPILLSAFFSFAKNLFVPPSTYGIGQPQPVKTLAQAFDLSSGTGRHKLVLVNNGYSGGEIDRVLDQIAAAVADYGSPMTVIRSTDERPLATECRSSLRGVTACFGAVIMHSSPREGPTPVWNYTIRSDSYLASSPLRINVETSNNQEEVYLLPLQRAIDAAIASRHGPGTPLARNEEMPFTSMTQEERRRQVRERYQSAIVNFMGVAFISTIIWITYHLTGFIATERETGIAQLMDAMMAAPRPWLAPAARILAHHLSFSAIYAPAWIIGSVIIRFGVFTDTSLAIVILFHIISGLALASFSILIASLFRKAQLSSVTATLTTLLLGILAQSITAPSTGVVAALSVLFTPCNYVYFITLMARFERQSRATSLVELPPDSPWRLPGIFFWVLVIIQIFLYPLFAVFLEVAFYGTSTEDRHLSLDAGSDQDPHKYAVRIDGLTKIYRPSLFARIRSRLRLRKGHSSTDAVVAVCDLSFSVGRGQIVALLGANGSGKSTTLNAIAGLHRPTSGSITIDGAGGLGIAPQKNVLWDQMTVEEHLTIFNRLKSPKQLASKEEIAQLVEDIDLQHKRTALSKTLSGGQKRKLQLGIMLTGGSSVCCIDEVSSGLDPLSRRKIWDILLAERARRTLILTTHFLDEADMLADHIAILSKGTLRAEGSAAGLKAEYGGGYRVQVPKKTHREETTPEVAGISKREASDSTTYLAPTSELAAEAMKKMEAAGISDYRFSGPTIEDVFLRLAEEAAVDQGQGLDAGSQKRLEEKIDGTDNSSQVSSQQHQPLALAPGRIVGYGKQIAILFRKRLTILKRNWTLYLVAFLLPVFAAGLTSLYVRGSPQPGCSAAGAPASAARPQDVFSQGGGRWQPAFLVGPPAAFAAASDARLVERLLPEPGRAALANARLVDGYDSFLRLIADNRRLVTTALWLGDESSPPTVGWVANRLVTSSLAAQQYLDVMLASVTIATTWSAFDLPFTPSVGDALNLVIYMGLALACYPAFFALYPSSERRRMVRALQYSNGVRPLSLWAAYLVFDLIVALAASALMTALWAALSGIWYHIGYVFLVLFLYGIASTLLAYIISLFAATQLASFAWTAALQAVFFLGYLVAYFCVMTYVQVNRIDSTLLICHFVISAFAPIGSAMRALFLAINLFETACDGTTLSTRPGGILYYGGPILYLLLQTLILLGLLLWLDTGSVASALRRLLPRRRRSRRRPSVAPTGDKPGPDPEAADKLAPAAKDGARDLCLQVRHLSKTFGSNTALEDVSFGVKRGEVFALLGPNGAGKSTMISLIRGDLKPELGLGSEILVQDDSVTENLASARSHLGVCPQVDALDQMTVREQLEFYARVRGLGAVDDNVSAVLRAVGLQAVDDRMADALSGGNKRKLGLGIALMGNPSLVLLDEPSSGLDAAAKRIMWTTLAAIAPGRGILLTTHSMEEADALAGRAGILARRMLALGTPDELRHRFGDALDVHLVARGAPRTPDSVMEAMAAWVRQRLPSARIEGKTYHGQMRFSVEARDLASPGAHQTSAIGSLVVLLEDNKAHLGVEYYSVSPTTLDKVFLAIVSRHRVQEDEGLASGHRSRVWSRTVGRWIGHRAAAAAAGPAHASPEGRKTP